MSKHKPITPEMIGNLSNMGDKDFMKKWGTSRQYPIRNRKRLNIPPFNNQHGTREHRFEGSIEYKYCPSDGGHWAELLGNFGIAKERIDGYRAICKFHEAEKRKEESVRTRSLERAKVWRKTDGGRKSLRKTWRKVKAKKVEAYVLWEHKHEERAYNVFDGSCAYCGLKVDFLKIEFDHFVPIKNGGKTEPGNMLPCCKKCNHGVGGKFTKDAWEWLQSRFSLERAGHIYNDCKEKLLYLQLRSQQED